MKYISLQTLSLHALNLANTNHKKAIDTLSLDCDTYKGLKYSITDTVAHLNNSNQHYYLVLKEESIIGYLSFYFINKNISMRTIGFDYAILPNMRRQGYATTLLKEFGTFFVENGVQYIYGFVYPDNEASRIAFQKAQYQPYPSQNGTLYCYDKDCIQSKNRK